MSGIISINITKRNEKIMASTAFGFDTDDIISTIRNNGLVTYFTSRELRGMDKDSRNNAQVNWESGDTLAAIILAYPGFVLLTVLFRDEVRQVDMKGESIIFNVNKMMEAITADPVGGGSKFYYLEEGNPDPMQYTVSETIAQIAAASAIVSPPSLIYNEVPAGVQDSVNTVFTLSFVPIGGSLQLVMNGAVLKPTADYTLAGNTITFVVAPDPGDSILAFYLK